MISLKSVKKWSLRSIVVVMILGGGAFLWTDYQLNRFAGAYTKVVDHTRFKGSSTLTAITDVNVLSPDGSAMLKHQTVLFDQGRIISVTGELELPSNAFTVDGSGRYLIPGLVDTHVHLKQSPNDLLLFVATGVTQVWEMSGNADHLQWRREIEAGRLGPRLFIASEKLQNSRGWLDGHFQRWTRNRITVDSSEDVNALVQSLMDDGYDAVKLGSELDKPIYHEVNRAALNAGIPVIGHLPISTGLDDLWKSGQTELAHAEEITKALDREFGYFNSLNAAEYLEFVAQRSAGVAEQLVANDVSVASTVWLMESFPRQKTELDVLLGELRLRYANPGVVEGTPLSKGWLPGNSYYQLSADTDPAKIAAETNYWMTYAKAQHILLGAMRDKGVRLMAGTDTNNAVVVPGFSLHDELKSLTAAGLSPSQSLLSATSAPADWMQDKAGKILPGYRADMVLLRENPLDDIANTTSIESVIVNGRVLARSQLDAILGAVQEANDASRTIQVGGR